MINVQLLALLGFLVSGRSQNFSTPANGDLRLTNGSTNSSGFLEIFYNGLWGTICFTESFNSNTSLTACRQLGYVGTTQPAHAESSVEYFTVGSGMSSGSDMSSVPVWFTDVECSQQELHLLRCGVSSNVPSSCTDHSQDVYLNCNSTLLSEEPYVGQVFLNNTESPYKSQGLLQVYLNGKWGTVCSIGFDSEAPANSVCQQLGYTNAVSYGVSPVPGSGTIWLNNASKCDFNESCFKECYIAPTIRDISCNHVADVAVYCVFNSSLNESRPSGSKEVCQIEVKRVSHGVVAFLTILFSAVMVIYVTGFVVRCAVAAYHNTSTYREKTMRSGEVERRVYVPIQNSLTESEVHSPLIDSSSSDSELAAQL